MNVTVEETGTEGNVLKSVSVTVSRDDSPEKVEAELKAKRAEQDAEANEVATLETNLQNISMSKEA